MGSGQLLTLRSLAQLPAEPSGGGGRPRTSGGHFCESRCRAGLREGRGALARTSGREGSCSPRHPVLFSSPSFVDPSPQAPSLTPAPALPAFPAQTCGASFTGGLASPEGTLDLPENATIFQCPWSISKLQQATRLRSCQ